MAFQTEHIKVDGSLNVDGSIYQFNELFTPGVSGGGGDVAWASGNVGSDNQLITANGDGSIVAESNLTFDGTNMNLPTNSNIWMGNTGDSGGRLRLHQIGDNSYIDFGDNLYIRGGMSSSNTIMALNKDSDSVDITGSLNVSSVLDAQYGFFGSADSGDSHIPYYDGTIYLSYKDDKSFILREYNGTGYTNRLTANSSGVDIVGILKITNDISIGDKILFNSGGEYIEGDTLSIKIGAGGSNRFTISNVNSTLYTNFLSSSNKSFDIGNSSTFWRRAYLDRLIINDNSIYIDSDSSNMTFYDSITGSKTLAELATGGGNIYKVGTPASDQIAIWTGDGSLTSYSSLYYDGNGLLNLNYSQNEANSIVVTNTNTTGTSVSSLFRGRSVNGGDFIIQAYGNAYNDSTWAGETLTDDVVFQTISESDLLIGTAGNNLKFIVNDNLQMRISQTGVVTFNSYGSGTFTGTATKWLAVNSTGNIIEEDPPTGGGGGGDVAWASGNVGSDNQLITANGDGSIVAESNLTFDGTNLVVKQKALIYGDGQTPGSDSAVNIVRSANAKSGTDAVLGSMNLEVRHPAASNGNASGIKFVVGTVGSYSGTGAILAEREGGFSAGALHFAAKYQSTSDQSSIPIAHTLSGYNRRASWFDPASASTERVRFNLATGQIDADGDVVAYSTLVSDRRLKENIITLENSLDKVLKLRGVSYNRKKNGDFHLGYIAQEVEKIIPSVIVEKNLPLESGDEETLYKTIRYQEIIPVITEAMKEQQKIIDSQKEEIDELKEKLALVMEKLNI